jgi:hypothetical protein
MATECLILKEKDLISILVEDKLIEETNYN